MRLIDADALMRSIDINWGCNKCKAQCVDEWGVCSCVVHQLKEIVTTTPTISQWIPVSERLPGGKDDSYLVTRTDGKYTWVEEGDFVIDSFYFIGDEYRFDLKRKIENIAWMPLPETYKEEK